VTVSGRDLERDVDLSEVAAEPPQESVRQEADSAGDDGGAAARDGDGLVPPDHAQSAPDAGDG